MGTAAQIDPCALAVERDGLVRGQIADDPGLVGLARRLEEARRLVTVPDLALDGLSRSTISAMRASIASRSSGVKEVGRAKS